MERKKYILIVLPFLLVNLSTAQVKESIYRAYISGNMEQWKASMDAFQPRSKADLLELVNYQYGYIGYCIERDDRKEAQSYLMACEKLLQKLEQEAYHLATINAYKSAIIGFKIGLQPLKAPIIGPESLRYAEKALDIERSNALAHEQLGNIAFYTPRLFGGSKEQALAHYSQALALMEQNESNLNLNWNYLNLLASLILNYEALEQYTMAQKFCLKALQIEPEFEWVQEQLYPNIIKQLQHE